MTSIVLCICTLPLQHSNQPMQGSLISSSLFTKVKQHWAWLGQVDSLSFGPGMSGHIVIQMNTQCNIKQVSQSINQSISQPINQTINQKPPKSQIAI